MTNASLIDESMVEKLKDINPLFQITFDGTKKRHDTIRTLEKKTTRELMTQS